MASPIGSLSNNQKIPLIGFGTWQIHGQEATRTVKDAIDTGYRLIDCAMRYGNEKEVGQAFQEKFDVGKVKRSDLYITGKLWCTFFRPDLVEGACKTSLQDLRLDYLDLYLLHWPFDYSPEVGATEGAKDYDGKIPFGDTPLEDTWAAMEKLVDKGLVKSIGVANTNSEQIERILKVARIRPVINQVECHPWLNQTKLRDFCLRRGILLQAFAPLGSPKRRWADKDDPVLMEDPTIVEIAKKHKRQPAQILLKFLKQRNIIPIPKSTKRERMKANLELHGFCLDQSDMEAILNLDRGYRLFPMEDGLGHREFPFAIEY